MSSTGPAGGLGPSGGGGTGNMGGGQGNPSQLHGHFQYMKGAAEEIIGRVTGATSLQSSGRADQAAAISEMRAAKDLVDPSNTSPIKSTSNSETTVVASDEPDVNSGTRQGVHAPVAGSAEILSVEGKGQKIMGRMVGCKGLQQEGDQKVTSAEALKRGEAREGGSSGVEGL